jgi:hypothetical protein
MLEAGEGQLLGAAATARGVCPFHDQDAKPGGREGHGRRQAVGAAPHHHRVKFRVHSLGNVLAAADR